MLRHRCGKARMERKPNGAVFRYDLVWEFVSAIVEERDALPGFDHGARAQFVADACLESFEKKAWVDINSDLG